ncbi:hypothetical protein [Porphyromonas sp.]
MNKLPACDEAPSTASRTVYEPPMATIFRLHAPCDILVAMSPIEVDVEGFEDGEDL